MPYAGENKISTEPFEGAIEITDAQYQQAIAGLMEGKIIKIDGGFAVIDPPPPPAPPPPPPPEPMLSKVDFIAKLTEVPIPPIFTESEAMLAMQSFPAKFWEALAGHSTTDKLAAVKLWNEISFIPRNHSLFGAVLAYYQAQNNLTDAEAAALADQIFEGAV